MKKRTLVTALFCCVLLSATLRAADVEQWGRWETTLAGPATGNPFVDVTLLAKFTSGDRTIDLKGFYDGDGQYRIRFMPPAPGVWHWETRSNVAELGGKRGEITVDPATGSNHGPVQVADKFHFRYADGTPHRSIGTTAYAWIHASSQIADQTLATLKSSPFSKVRMCVFPTKYGASDPPPRFPFVKHADGKFDLKQFDVEFFRNLENRVQQLGDIGIQADVILFHPYDGGQMGFDRMPADADDRYLSYVVARLASYRNVWWSMANEFDLMKEKHDEDWDRYFKIVQAEDPYGHLRSIHHSQRMYDSAKPWVTHVSVQNGIAPSEPGRAVIYRQAFNKPIVFDEVKYEGNIERRWGQLSGEEMLLRFWYGTIAGTYVGHSEAIRRQGQPVWMSKGGTFGGQSPERIAFLKKILDEAPVPQINPIDQYYETRFGGKGGEYYLVYFGREKPDSWHFELPREGMADGLEFKVDVIDTWNMTIAPVEQTFRSKRHTEYVYWSDPDATITLPGRPYIALRIKRVGGAATRPASQDVPE